MLYQFDFLPFSLLPFETEMHQMQLFHGNSLSCQISHQNTHWRESKQMQQVQLFRNHIIRHMLIHSGEKPHKCTECKKSFSKAVTLDRHLLLCTLGRSPTLVLSVKNHWLKLNSEEPYAHPQWREVAQMHSR